MASRHDPSDRPRDLSERRSNDFDSVAWLYDGLARVVFAGAIQRAQLALIPELKGAQTGVILGGGTGWIAVALLRQLGLTRLLYIEKSQNMLERTRARFQREAPELAERVEFRLGTELSLSEDDGSFDLVVTNFFLDLFRDAQCLEVARRLQQHLSPTGSWMFVDFRKPPHLLAQPIAAVLFTTMFRFFNVVSRMQARRLPDFDRVFAALDLRTVSRQRFFASMIEARMLRRVDPC